MSAEADAVRQALDGFNKMVAEVTEGDKSKSGSDLLSSLLASIGGIATAAARLTLELDSRLESIEAEIRPAKGAPTAEQWMAALKRAIDLEGLLSDEEVYSREVALVLGEWTDGEKQGDPQRLAYRLSEENAKVLVQRFPEEAGKGALGDLTDIASIASMLYGRILGAAGGGAAALETHGGGLVPLLEKLRAYIEKEHPFREP